jgi:ribosomal-protein-alanine N-acetyltransferase
MIQGEKVTLRTVMEEDLDTLFDLLSDVKNRGHYVNWNLPTQVMHRQQFQDNCFWGESMGTLLICVADQIVGTIAFAQDNLHDALEIGYAVFKEENRNQGYATEALSLFCQYLFSTKKINRLQISVNPDNIPSKRVAVNCGFIFEGVLREASFVRGSYQDVAVYSLLKSEVDCL